MRRVEYYRYYKSPTKVVFPEGEEPRAYRLNPRTGLFELRDIYTDIELATTEDIDHISEEEFIEETERMRARWKRGDADVRAIYDTIDAMYQAARDEGRLLTMDEVAVVDELRRRSFALFEAAHPMPE
jgi:hypothetical protein